jgi:hypothetical protein
MVEKDNLNMKYKKNYPIDFNADHEIDAVEVGPDLFCQQTVDPEILKGRNQDDVNVAAIILNNIFPQSQNVIFREHLSKEIIHCVKLKLQQSVTM